MTISMLGLGYVGTVSAACLAQRGHRVIGVDVNREKTNLVNTGRSPITEEGVAELITAAHCDGRLSATTDAATALAESDMAFICIGTPSRTNGSLDTRYIISAARAIAEALTRLKRSLVIVLRSTVTPGTTEEVILPILESGSGKKDGKDFSIAYHPEFMREGNAVYDFYHPAKIVVGGRDPEAIDKVFSLYEGIEAERFRTNISTAEMVKYVDNTFHAVKITFANEIGHLCRRLGLDTENVMGIFKKDAKLNISEKYLTPGMAFGGSCLPKDLRAITYLAKMRGLETPLLSSVLVSNHVQILDVVNRIVSSGLRRIGIAGLSFKAGTDDIRESPFLEITEILLGKGYSLAIYDPAIILEKLLGANRELLLKCIPRFSEIFVSSLDDLIEKSELIIVGNSSPEFRDLAQQAGKDRRILDCAGIAKPKKNLENYEGICW